MNEPMTSRLADADMQAAPAALLRAALRARELARQTGTPLVVVREGETTEEITTPDSLEDQHLVSPSERWLDDWRGQLLGKEQAATEEPRLSHLLDKHLR